MSDPVLFLSRPASEGLVSMLEPQAREGLEPVWRLLATAVFAAGAALTFATVVIFGAPGGGLDGLGKDHPVRVAIAGPAR